MRLRCPHCGAFGNVRTSETMSPTVTWMYIQCTDLECGHAWRVDAEASVTLSPSARPNVSVYIPLSPHVRRGLLTRLLEVAPVGDHQSKHARNIDLFDDDVPAARGCAPPRLIPNTG